MFKAKVSPYYFNHKVDPVSGPGAQEYNVCKEKDEGEGGL